MPDKQAVFDRCKLNFRYRVAEARRYLMAKTNNMKEHDWASPVLFMRAHAGMIFEGEKAEAK